MLHRSFLVWSAGALLATSSNSVTTGVYAFVPPSRSCHVHEPKKNTLHSSLPSLKYNMDDASIRTTTDQVKEENIRQARAVAFADSNEYNQHYHPYKDEDEQLRQAKYWLQTMKQLLENKSDEVSTTEMDDIVTQLESQVQRYERRIAKRNGAADSVVPSIALELTLASLVLVVAVFWTTLDLTQRHEVTLSNLQDWLALVQNSGYLVSMFDMSKF